MNGPIVWLLVAYLVVLGYFTFHKDRWDSTEPLRKAWITFSGVPLSIAVFTLFRVFNHDDVRDMILVGIWENGFVWLFLGLSIYRLSELLGDGSGNQGAKS